VGSKQDEGGNASSGGGLTPASHGELLFSIRRENTERTGVRETHIRGWNMGEEGGWSSLVIRKIRRTGLTGMRPSVGKRIQEDVKGISVTTG